jgi:serine/threonine-protein kinase
MDQSSSNGNKAADDISGKTLGDFHIVRRIGQGGMGQVYLAEQTSLKRKVALKILRPDLAANDVALSRFRTEAESVARINHPNIVQVFTVGQHDSTQFMALEYVEGMNLRDYLAKKGAPDLPRALLIMRQIAAALQRASETGIVHRDIKPENILLTRKGEVKVTDFGLSRVFGTDEQLNLTKSGITMGTPLYMSPEQVQGQTVDPRSDIYSFGVTCYHLLTGQPPFTGQNAFEVALKHVNEKPRPIAELRPDLPAEVCQLVDRMLIKEPSQRPQSGREVLKALNNLRGQSTETTLAELPIDVPVLLTKQPSATLPTPLSLSGLTTQVGTGWRVVGLGALALLLGAIARWGINPAHTSVDPSAQASFETNADEKYLLETARQASAGGLASQTNLQIAYRAHVGVVAHYLDQHRYAEAGEFIIQMNTTDPGMSFFKTLFHGMLLAFENEPEKALDTLRLAFNDANRPKYLNLVFNPPTRESVDLRSLMLEAFDRISKSHALTVDLLSIKRDWETALRRSPSAISKGK